MAAIKGGNFYLTLRANRILIEMCIPSSIFFFRSMLLYTGVVLLETGVGEGVGVRRGAAHFGLTYLPVNLLSLS